MSQLPVPVASGLPANLPQGQLNIPHPPIGGVWTTLALESMEDRIRAANLGMGKGRAAEEVVGQEILIQDLLTKGVQITNPESGEVTDCVLCLLIPPKGDPVQCVSWSVLGALETIAAIVGRPPWRPALRVRLESQRTNRKYLIYRLVVLGTAAQE